MPEVYRHPVDPPNQSGMDGILEFAGLTRGAVAKHRLIKSNAMGREAPQNSPWGREYASPPGCRGK